MVRLLAFIFVWAATIAGTLSAAVPVARAAELRLSFAELASVAQTVLGDAKVYLNNKPGAFLGLGGASSSLTVAGTQVPLPVDAFSFILDGSYAYYLSDITSTSVRMSTDNGAVRLTVTFEMDGPELTGACISGACFFNRTLPDVEWTAPSLIVDLIPVLTGKSLSLQVRSARLGGTLTPVCRNETGYISSSVCQASLPLARTMIAKYRNQVNTLVRDKVNAPAMQANFVAQIEPYLKVGPAGGIEIQKLTTDARGVVVAFRFGG